ncbi:MAG: tRNA (guanosine(46)-N7)-methyltransferase TrmB [Muribaculaceae bacterium]|nr:tRNA (guanosine(46)-N7)-methyltransferase TrmB [Muribaculaceae bacterium]
MGKNKLKKFADMQQLDFVYQYPFARLQNEGFPLRGEWNDKVFHNSNPIILELGCGKGEYAVGLAQRYPECNFIGIDIKGARMWTGARQVVDKGLDNVAFLRTSIELLPYFFAHGEVSEIWITFPDPQMKKTRKRLTSTRFMELYRQILKPLGRINLKTDSPFLYTYTRRMAELNRMPELENVADLYNTSGVNTALTDIRTHYEQQWLDRGLTIKYITFRLPSDTLLSEPEEDDIERDTYRSYSRGYIQMPQLLTADDTDPLSGADN